MVTFFTNYDIINMVMNMNNKIEEYRKNKRITQVVLSEKVGVTRKTIGLIEKGIIIPRIDLAFKIAIELDTYVDDLFMDSNYQDAHKNDLRICGKGQDNFMRNFAETYTNLK